MSDAVPARSLATPPPGSRSIVKIAYAVDDVRAAAADWAARLGAGPFFVKDHIPMADTHGSEQTFDHTSAFGRWGNVMVELIQIHDVKPEVAAGHLLRPGLHHVTWFADSLEDESRRLVDLGWPKVFTATTAGGVTFTLHDATKDLGHLVEIYERSLRVVANYDQVEAAARGWDGSDPVR